MPRFHAPHWINVSLLACCIPATSAQTQMLADDLCNYSVAGLSLASSKAELDTRFSAMGWHAKVESANDIRTRKLEERYTYTRLPPEVTPADGYRPGEKQPRYDSTFTLLIIDGVPTTFSYSHHFQTEGEFAQNDIEGPLQQAQTFCAQTDARFASTGCNRAYRGANVISTTLTPVNKNGAYCRVSLSAQEGSSFGYTVSRISAEQAGRLQDRSEGRGRGR